MLKKRVLTSLVGLPILIAAVWFDKPVPWFSILAAAWSLLAAFEFYRITSVNRLRSLTVFGLIVTLLFVLSPHFKDVFPFIQLLAITLVLSLVLLIFQRQKEGLFISWAWTIAGILYVGLLLSFLVALRLEGGAGWLFLALFATFGSDTAAYFVGRGLGRHRLSPAVSPGKTWEGAIGALFGAVIVSLLVVTLFRLPLTHAQTVMLGLLASILGQVGDYAESLLKRNMGVKESGRLMPGHGGLLDRMDSMVLAGVVVYYFLMAHNMGWLNW